MNLFNPQQADLILAELTAKQRLAEQHRSGKRERRHKVAGRIKHDILHDLKIVTSPVWWPVSKALSLAKRKKADVQSGESFSTDLDRPLYK